MSDADKVRKKVSRDYARVIAQQPASGCACSSSGCCGGTETTGIAGYSDGELVTLPKAASTSSFGCGNPVALSEIGSGETVLDLGSGTGLDLLLSARRVGEEGRVIGVDMTDEMIARARENIAASGLTNVEVRKGIIEELPVEDSSVDWVISNCVINLSPEKERVFAEIARVLRPGGRMLVSDIVVSDLPEWTKQYEGLYSACIAGAIDEESYVAGLKGAGLEEVEVRDRLVYDASQLKAFLQVEMVGKAEADSCSGEDYLTGRLLGRAGELLAGKIWSALFYARKP